MPWSVTLLAGLVMLAPVPVPAFTMVEPMPAPERRAEDRPGQVPLCRLPYHLVSLAGETGLASEGAAG